MTRRVRSRVPVLALVAVALWGASFVAVRVALESFHPFGLTAARLVLGTVLLAVVQRARGRPLLPERRDFAACALLGTILGAHLSVQAFGLLYTTAIHTGWIIGFTPVAIALGAQLFLRQSLHALGWLGVALAAAGVLVVTVEEPPDFTQARFGDFLQLLTCFTWAAYTLLGARVVERNGSLRVTLFAMGTAAVLLLALSVGTGVVEETPGVPEIGALLFLGFLCSGVAITLWYRAQATHGSHRTGATLYYEPFVTLIVATALLDEMFGAKAFAGGLLVLAGVWLVGRGIRH